MEVAEKTIHSAVKECDKHLDRIRKARQRLEKVFPLTAGQLDRADDALVEHIDQFVYRFTKLQDAMGTRLLPTLHAFLEENDRPLPFLDVLGTLEKYQVIPSLVEWQFFRNLRNSLAHEYPEDIEQTVQALNTLYGQWPRMEAMYEQVRGFYLARQTQ
jgi:hypothetical protein